MTIETSKRLNLIKQLLLLEEFELLDIQLEKLITSTDGNNFKEIIENINNKSFNNAIQLIQNKLNAGSNLVLREDEELTALKMEIKALELNYNIKINEVAETEKLIHNFTTQQNHELGELLNEILRFRRDKLEKEKGKSKKKKIEFEEANSDYEKFNEQYEVSKREIVNLLNEKQKKELKKNYRKASKLCHPDIVNENLKFQSQEIFRELRLAYEQNDLERVSEILDSLENDNLFIKKSDSINEKSILKVEIINLRKKISNIEDKLNELKNSETYQSIIKIENWESYFENTKKTLFEELRNLKDNE
ncbi:J domain-containing protein [Algibacter sp. PT7-4]|uniref:J domain-containing protein n=1 Tax=Algibacter ulvanivorans TaxID=3400999 RepID=UPI003AAF7AE7